MKAEAGIYILKNTEKKKRVNHELSEKSRGMLLDALGNQVNKIDINAGNNRICAALCGRRDNENNKGTAGDE